MPSGVGEKQSTVLLSDNKAHWPETESKCRETFHGVQLELINNGERTFLLALQEIITKQREMDGLEGKLERSSKRQAASM